VTFPPPHPIPLPFPQEAVRYYAICLKRSGLALDMNLPPPPAGPPIMQVEAPSELDISSVDCMEALSQLK